MARQSSHPAISSGSSVSSMVSVCEQIALIGPAPPQKPTDCRMRVTWMRPGSSWWISRIFPMELFCP